MEDQGGVCPHCGERNPPLLTLCRRCGKSLSAPASGAPGPPDSDVTALLRQALLDQRDAEEFDDALLRAAKDLCADRWSQMFAAASQQVAEEAARRGSSKRVAAQELLRASPRPGGEASPHLQEASAGAPTPTDATATIRFQRESRVQLTARRLEELPPEARAEAERALAAQGRVPIEDTPRESQQETVSLQVSTSQNGLTDEQMRALREALERGVSLDQVVIERVGPPRNKGCLGAAALLALPVTAMVWAIVSRL